MPEAREFYNFVNLEVKVQVPVPGEGLVLLQFIWKVEEQVGLWKDKPKGKSFSRTMHSFDNGPSPKKY